MPKFIVGAVNKRNYLPGTVFFKYTNGQLSLYESGSNNSALIPISSTQDVVFLNGLSVAHLGDEQSGGNANSQLQAKTIGLVWNDSFHLTAAQRNTNTTLTVTLYARVVESGPPDSYCDRIALGNTINPDLVTKGTTQILRVTSSDG